MSRQIWIPVHLNQYRNPTPPLATKGQSTTTDGATRNSGTGSGNNNKIANQNDSNKMSLSLDDFETISQQIVSQFAEEADLKKQTLAGLSRIWKSPASAELSAASQVAGWSDDDARRVLFDPMMEDMRRYPKLLAASSKKARNPSLSMFYLRHVRRWPLVQEFILSQGLLSLVSLLDADQPPQVQSQAIDCLWQITSHAGMNWFEQRPAKNSLPHYLYLALFVAGSGGMLKHLVAARRSPVPGVSHSCLRLLAFWLSWVRLQFCPDRKLRVSAEILDALRDWFEHPSASASADETLFAKEIYEDFSREAIFPGSGFRISADSTDLITMTSRVEELPAVAVAASTSTSASSSRNAASAAASRDSSLLSETEKMDKLHEQANAAFRNGDFSAAIAVYKQILDVDSVSPKTFSNRAAAYLRRGASFDEKGIPTSVHSEDDIVLAVRDCNEAILRDAAYPKPYYRKAQALLALRHYRAAFEAAQMAQKLMSGEKEVRHLYFVCDRLKDKSEKEQPQHLPAAAATEDSEQTDDPYLHGVESSSVSARDPGSGSISGPGMTIPEIEALDRLLSGGAAAPPEAAKTRAKTTVGGQAGMDMAEAERVFAELDCLLAKDETAASSALSGKKSVRFRAELQEQADEPDDGAGLGLSAPKKKDAVQVLMDATAAQQEQQPSLSSSSSSSKKKKSVKIEEINEEDVYK